MFSSVATDFGSWTNSKILYNVIQHGMAFLFKICIPYNSKFSLMSTFLGTNGVIIKRAHCVIGRI